MDLSNGLEESLPRSTLLKSSMVTEQLCVDTIRNNSTLTLVLQVVGTAELGEAPLSALNDLLAARELELGATQSFTGMCSIVVLASNRKEDLTMSTLAQVP